MKLLLLTFLLFAFSIKSFSQDSDLDWWVKKHNFDGSLHWHELLTYSPKYFGPNALAVPEVKEGIVEKEFSFETRLENHFAKGDNTSNIFMSMIYPIKNKASFEVFIVPLEYYSITDSNIRDERAIRSYNPKGIAGGDFYFGTNIQIIENYKKLPDISFSAYFKTASGTNLYDARYTDAPAYYMSLSFGKNLIKSEDKNFRIFCNLGTYIWQTFDHLHPQNDAFLYGLGFTYNKKSFHVKTSFSGYSGYLHNGDQPLVLRANFGLKSKNKHWLYSLKTQYGIFDFPYNTIALSLQYNLKLNNE